jgi:hypothetical protein
MNEMIKRTSTSTWLPWREAIDRVAGHLGYPPENARLRIVRKAKVRPVRAHGRTAEGWSVGWSVSPVSVAGYAIDLDSGALGPPHFSGEVINYVKLCIDDMIAADLLPASGRPEGPVERAWWPAVEAAAYIIKGAPIEWEDWGPGMHREAARSEIKLSEATREGLPARGRKKPGDPMEPIPAGDLRPDMVETRDLPVNLLYPPEVVVRVDGTVGISPPHRGNYIGPPWCSIEVDSAALRQACPKPLIAREPATPGGAGAEPPLDPLIEVLKEIYQPHGDVPDMPPRSDAQILGQIERRRPEFEDTFNEDSVNRARKQTRETALAASEK